MCLEKNMRYSGGFHIMEADKPTITWKKIVLIMIIIFISEVFCSVTYAATITAGPGGQYPTIQGAINASSPGDTISVEPGTYTETVNINKGNIRVVGSSTTPPVIVGRINSSHQNNITVDGFEIRNWTGVSHGITISYGQYLTVRNCTIHDGSGVGSDSGIYCRNSTDVRIENNEIYNCIKGINVASGHSSNGDYSGGVTITGNEIHDCPVDGIDVHGEYITIKENLIYDNISTDISGTHPDGIQFIASTADGYTSVQHARVFNNIIRNHTQNIFTEGTESEENSNCRDVHIYNNVVYNTSEIVNGVNMDSLTNSNLVIKYSRDVYIYNNTLGRAGNNGIYIHHCASNSIYVKNNIINNDLRNGIYVQDPADIAPGAMDYNLHYNSGGVDIAWGSSRLSLLNFQNSFPGYSQNSISGDPMLNLYPTPYLKEGSPAINAGVQLDDLYRFDKNGYVREDNNWDIGVFEYTTDVEYLPPSPPVLQILTQ
jgi:hypothetical protein